MTKHSLLKGTLAFAVAALPLVGCDRDLLVGTIDHPAHGLGVGGAGGSLGSGGAVLGVGGAGGNPIIPTGGVADVALGWYHACAHNWDGTVRCWGSNVLGQLGDGTTTDTSDSVVQPGGLLASVNASYADSCAVLLDGTVRCWGGNNYGQLGDGTTTQRLTPVQALGGQSVKQLSLGEYHSCALLQDDTVACWGLNSSGQLGDGTTTDRLALTAVPGLTGVKQIAAGANFTCALLSDQTVSCWGTNAIGEECGGSTNPMHTSPTTVPGVSNVTELATGSTHACALLTDGTISCWGLAPHGELGRTLTASHPCSPAVVLSSPTGVVHVTAGDGHSCALLDNGTARCWGYNLHGQLGDGTKVDHSDPAFVTGLSGIRQLVAGYMDTCAILTDGTLYCWGSVNPNGSTNDDITVPTRKVL